MKYPTLQRRTHTARQTRLQSHESTTQKFGSLLCAVVGGNDIMDADASRARPTGEH